MNAIAKPSARVNQEIRAKEVRVISPEGKQLGIMPVAQALAKAQEMDLDLVEVAPTAVPPVCRIMDYGRYKYEQSKKQHASRQHQRTTQVKEVKFRINTDRHDIAFKLKHARRFLEDGNKAKLTVVFRGREMTHTELGLQLLERLTQELTDAGHVERPPKQEGNTLSVLMAPKSKA